MYQGFLLATWQYFKIAGLRVSGVSLVVIPRAFVGTPRVLRKTIGDLLRDAKTGNGYFVGTTPSLISKTAEIKLEASVDETHMAQSFPLDPP